MKKLIERITEEAAKAFEKAGYDSSYARVTVSNRPDLCEYQCNGAMAAKKAYQKAPLLIAEDVAAAMDGSEVCEEVTAVKPGFINIKIAKPFLAEYLQQMYEDERLSSELSSDVSWAIG